MLHPWVPGGLFPLSPLWCHLTVLPQIHNKGPSTISGVTLRLTVPHQLGGRTLLYLLELGTEGGMNCTNPPGLNAEQVGCCLGTGTHPLGAGWVSRWCVPPLPFISFQLEIPHPTGAAPRNGTHRRERREVEEPPGAGLEEPIPVVSGCSLGTLSP